MRIPRLGYLSNPDLIEEYWADYDLSIGKRFADVVGIIESLGCGMAQLQSIGHQYATNFFCTKDTAKEAGQHSVMALKNVECLAKMFDLKKVSPEELVCVF